MKKRRTLWHKIVIAAKETLIVVGVGSLILDIANGYGFVTFTIKFVILGASLYVFLRLTKLSAKKYSMKNLIP